MDIINLIMSFYAVSCGRKIGIFQSWSECNASVKGYPNASYKKFDTLEEAKKFIQPTSQENIFDDLIQDIASMPKSTNKIDYYVYTDGACSNNGKSNACAGIGIYFGPHDERNVSKKIKGKQSNNVAELTAIIDTYEIIKNDIDANKSIAIVSDSVYALNCVGSYGLKCQKKNWKVDIPNKELVKEAYELYKNKSNVKFIHVKAHTDNSDVHSVGNDGADNLANMAIGLEYCPYNKK